MMTCSALKGLHIPSQCLPSECSSNPILQEHSYPPRVFMQLCSQPWFWRAHSSNSATPNNLFWATFSQVITFSHKACISTLQSWKDKARVVTYYLIYIHT
jgi:hypothetical protein